MKTRCKKWWCLRETLGELDVCVGHMRKDPIAMSLLFETWRKQDEEIIAFMLNPENKGTDKYNAVMEYWW
jgi:hypothetical protein